MPSVPRRSDYFRQGRTLSTALLLRGSRSMRRIKRRVEDRNRVSVLRWLARQHWRNHSDAIQGTDDGQDRGRPSAAGDLRSAVAVRQLLRLRAARSLSVPFSYSISDLLSVPAARCRLRKDGARGVWRPRLLRRHSRVGLAHRKPSNSRARPASGICTRPRSGDSSSATSNGSRPRSSIPTNTNPRSHAWFQGAARPLLSVQRSLRAWRLQKQPWPRHSGRSAVHIPGHWAGFGATPIPPRYAGAGEAASAAPRRL